MQYASVVLLQAQQRIRKYLKDCERDQSLGHVKILTNVSGAKLTLLDCSCLFCIGICCNCIVTDLFEVVYDDDGGDGICTVLCKNVENGKQRFDSL